MRNLLIKFNLIVDTYRLYEFNPTVFFCSRKGQVKFQSGSQDINSTENKHQRHLFISLFEFDHQKRKWLKKTLLNILLISQKNCKITINNRLSDIYSLNYFQATKTRTLTTKTCLRSKGAHRIQLTIVLFHTSAKNFIFKYKFDWFLCKSFRKYLIIKNESFQRIKYRFCSSFELDFRISIVERTGQT